MGLKKFFAWWSWLLKFNMIKYIGLFFMIFGPLAFIYLIINRDFNMISGIVGSLLLFMIGFIIWLNGWDPYENIIEENQITKYLIFLKEFFGILEWYKWILKFSFLKYISLAIMILGPYYFFYRIIFLGQNQTTNMIYSAVAMIIGIIIWLISWDPYS